MTELLQTRLSTAIPESISNIAAQAAYILDPDTGGRETYSENYTIEINGEVYYRADLPIWSLDEGMYPQLDELGMTNYGDILKSKNPDIWFNVLTTLATIRGREFTLSFEDVSILSNAMLFDEEITLV